METSKNRSPYFSSLIYQVQESFLGLAIEITGNDFLYLAKSDHLKLILTKHFVRARNEVIGIGGLTEQTREGIFIIRQHLIPRIARNLHQTCPTNG